VVVFAAGNDNREVSDDELCALPGVLCVSAIDNYGYPTSYTNFGGPVDVSAPSATVSISPVAEYTLEFGGTSAAAPVVAGLAGWILSVDPTRTADEVADLLIDTAAESFLVTHDEDGHHDTYGYGTIDPPAVLEVLLAAEEGDSGRSDGASETAGGSDNSGEEKSGCTSIHSLAPGFFPFGIMIWVIAGRCRPAIFGAAR